MSRVDTTKSDVRAMARGGANGMLLGAVTSYAITLAFGVQSAVGSMSLVLVATLVHLWLAATEKR